MTALGVVLCAATVTFCLAAFLAKPRRRFPRPGWVALLVLFVAELLMFRGIEPIATYFTPIAWTAYIVIIDAAIFSLRGSSPVRDAPHDVARMALLSVPLWLIFEAYNLRLDNWQYIGLPQSVFADWLGYVWSFATITPGLVLTADFLLTLGWFSSPRRPFRISRRGENVLILAGALCITLPLLLPRHTGAYFFGLIWIGFALFLDPILRRGNSPSFLADLAQGRWSRLCALLASGWICGWLWEFWNYWAAARWQYVFPILQNWKIFAMPAPGYLGFLPFAVEAYVLYVAVARLLRWPVLFSGTVQPVTPNEVRV